LDTLLSRNPTIFNIIRWVTVLGQWDKRLIDQAYDVPSIIFFIISYRLRARSLKLIVWPQEVSEVTEVKIKKILGENPKITNFSLTLCLVLNFKRILIKIVIHIWNKDGGFCNKNIKKSILWFLIPKNPNFLSVSAKFLKNLSR
jgi:hypothetical protein